VIGKQQLFEVIKKPEDPHKPGQAKKNLKALAGIVFCPKETDRVNLAHYLHLLSNSSDNFSCIIN